MGLDHGELLVWTRYVLFVEGAADEAVLTALYGSRLRHAGITILPIGGIDEAASLAELRLVGEVLDVGFGVLADHTRTQRLSDPRVPDERAPQRGTGTPRPDAVVAGAWPRN